MSESSPPTESSRPADIARLALTKLRIEDGIALETVFRRVTETAADVLNVERVGVWLLVDERQALRCVDLFERSKATHSVGITVQVCAFPEYFAALERRKTVPAEVALTDPRTSELADAYLTPLGITSMLDAPIFVGGEVVGVVCHEHIGAPREWTTEQRDFAGSMADVLALKIQAAAMAELQVALRTQAMQLAASRRVGSLAELAAGVAHDFNNILTVMIGGAELIAEHPACPAEVAACAQRITAAGQRGVALAKELMGFARPGPRSSRVVRPAEVITSQLVVLQAATGDRHPVNLEVRSAAGRVLIDPNQLERVVLNLVVNACDAMPAGGPIGVVVDAVVARDEDGKLGQYVLIAVSDCGTGIPPAVLARIFDPFFTTKPRGQGTGVGLAVVCQVVSYAGGFVRVETAVGRGSTFRVYLPQVSSA
jgi:two-component system, cell cycle sensor histidine kinase and response regulator CckA